MTQLLPQKARSGLGIEGGAGRFYPAPQALKRPATAPDIPKADWGGESMAEGEGAGAATLVICEGAFEGTRYPLCAEETLIGRNPTTDITLLDESISREHAIVSMDEATGEYVLEDLQSTNGSKVNGKRIRSSTLAHGDEVEIGHTKFKFFLNDYPE